MTPYLYLKIPEKKAGIPTTYLCQPLGSLRHVVVSAILGQVPDDVREARHKLPGLLFWHR